MMHTLLILTVALGCSATALSLALFWYFIRSRHRVGRAVAFMLLGEFTANVIVTVFASLELFGSLPDFPVIGQTVLRWVSLGVVMASSIHLGRVVAQVHD